VEIKALAGDSIKSIELVLDSIPLRAINDSSFVWGVDSFVDKTFLHFRQRFIL